MRVGRGHVLGYLDHVKSGELIVMLCRVFLHCRYLAQNMDWLQQSLGDFDDDYVLFDCPGK